jgi:Zn-dependent protease/CBS domain-containing protein
MPMRARFLRLLRGMRAESTAPGMRIGRIAGIAVHLDWSVMVIFALLVVSLAFGWLPAQHRDWSPPIVWVTALAAGVLFLISVLAHELSHALVGRAMGIPVRRITLFIFGGLAEMAGEPEKPSAELAMTIVGPFTSLLLGVLCTSLGLALTGGTTDPQVALQNAGPVPTVLLWLGPVNLVLGLFNLIPGFPLDGGRVLRAILWATTGSLEKATRWATALGRAFGYGLMGLGVLMAFGLHVPMLGVGLSGGLWMLMIGWFLSNAARASYEQLIVKDLLIDVPVTTLMKKDFVTVDGSTTVAAFVETHLLHHDQRSFPVTSADRMIGLISIDDVRNVPRDRRSVVTVGEVMTPASELATLSTENNAHEALQTLGTRQVDQLPVVKDGALLGLIRTRDIIRWLSLHRSAEATA